jgi:hypothetical protein
MQSYWPYYFALESDVDKLSRYVEFTEQNFSTYSIEMVRLYLSICSEIDVVMKEICKETLSNPKAKYIDEYRQVIKDEFNDFNNQKAFCQKFGLGFTPWQSWDKGISPKWWSNHNKVKHQRSEFYDKANLANVLESLAALYLTNIYLEFVKDKKLNPGFTTSIVETIPKIPVQLGLFRIDSLFAYINK